MKIDDANFVLKNSIFDKQNQKKFLYVALWIIFTEKESSGKSSQNKQLFIFFHFPIINGIF